ncbi:MAG: tetratricopeptide repeat protein [Cytophagales bacterium]|nr:tetratricopeptide repeat protein [Cytophagales bacterium]
MPRKLTLLFFLVFCTSIARAESAREYFKFAKFSFDSEDYYKALEYVNRAIEVDPKYVSGFLLRAEINFSLNDFIEVVDDITYAFNLDENANKTMAEFHLLRGDAYLNLNDYSKALDDIDYCLRLNPRNARAHYLKGMINIGHSKMFAALESLDQAIKLDSDESEYYYQRAELKKMHFRPLPGTKTYESIMSDIKVAIALDPDDHRPYKLKCDMRKLDEKYSKNDLIEELDTYINYFPETSAFYSERGLAKVLNNQYKEALSDFTMAIQLDENNESNYRNRGLCFHNMSKYQLALNDYSKSIDILIKKYQASENDDSIKKLLSQTLNMRGMTNEFNGNSDLACEDYYKAAKLGLKAGLNNYRKNCNVFN